MFHSSTGSIKGDRIMTESVRKKTERTIKNGSVRDKKARRKKFGSA